MPQLCPLPSENLRKHEKRLQKLNEIFIVPMPAKTVANWQKSHL
jgi:hypothetical protein